MNFRGVRVAVAGMGVSGLAVGRAVKALGGDPVVFDQKPNDNPTVMAAVDALDSAEVQAVTGWHGRLDPKEFDLLVVSPGFPQQHPAINDMTNGGREIWSEVEFASRIAKAPIVAITGTNGKSTTTVLTWLLLKGSGRNAVLCGNIAGSGYPEMTLTEAAMNAKESDILVAEVSSYHLEWVKEFRPNVAAVTNITPDHMDRYKFFQDYFNTKLKLYSSLGEGDVAVVNLDEPSLPLTTVEASLKGPATLVTFSPTGTQPATGVTKREGGNLWLSGMEAQISDLPLLGEHNVTNAMMAWEIAASLAAPGPGTLAALHGFKGLANRMEILGQRGGVTVINNSMCTNPAAVIASSRSVSGHQHVLMGGVTKNLDFRPVGNYVNETGHQVYLFGPGPEAMNEMLLHEWPHFASMEDAFLAACGSASPGETVLLAPGCASAEPYTNFKERGEAFRKMATEWLERKT